MKRNLLKPFTNVDLNSLCKEVNDYVATLNKKYFIHEPKFAADKWVCTVLVETGG